MSARNVYNVAALDAFLARLAGETDHEPLQRWLKTTARRWIINHYDGVRPLHRISGSGRIAIRLDGRVTDLQETDGAPPGWVSDALDRHETVLFLLLDEALATRLRRMAGYLQARLRETGRINWTRLAFSDAESESRTWRPRPGRPAWRDAVEGVASVFSDGDGFEVVGLESAAALEHEGRRMHHCIGCYDRDVAQGTAHVFSLRDRNDRPLATMDVSNDGWVIQIRAAFNRPVAREHHPPLVAFADAAGLRGMDAVLRQPELLGLGDAEALRDAAPGAAGNVGVNGNVLRHLFDDARAGGLLARLRAGPRDAATARDAQWLVAALRRVWRDEDAGFLEHCLEAIGPQPGCRLFTARRRTVFVYDLAVPIVEMGAPATFLYACKAFGAPSPRLQREVARVRREMAAELMVCLDDPGLTLYDFGIYDRAGMWSAGLYLANHVAHGTRVDFEALRKRRALGIRQALNSAKRRCRGVRGKPDVAHAELRRMLDDSSRYLV